MSKRPEPWAAIVLNPSAKIADSKRAKKIAAWLRKQADWIEKEHATVAPRFRARMHP